MKFVVVATYSKKFSFKNMSFTIGFDETFLCINVSSSGQRPAPNNDNKFDQASKDR